MLSILLIWLACATGQSIGVLLTPERRPTRLPGEGSGWGADRVSLLGSAVVTLYQSRIRAGA